MSEEDLQLLITLDNPGELPEEDAFNHLQVNNLGYWFAQGATNESMKVIDLEVCTVTRWKNGRIAEQKVFYDLAEMQKQIGIR